jgi:predicted phosphate transport protein (TIGR00153 family)
MRPSHAGSSVTSDSFDIAKTPTVTVVLARLRCLSQHRRHTAQPMRLLPREESYFDQFEQQGRKTVEGCRAFLELVDNLGEAASRAKVIKQIEEECDTITHGVVAKLHKTFITPIDRNDIYRLITKMDDVMDFVDAAAERISLYEITSGGKELRELGNTLLTCAERVLDAVKGLRDLRKPAAILESCVEINRLENVADGQLRALLARLFREEKDPIAVIKWKEIYELLESATDRCEDVANVIEGVVLENS